MKYIPKTILPEKQLIDDVDKVTPIDSNKNVSIYKLLTENVQNNYITPYNEKIYPSISDFDNGYLMRYFIRQRNDISSHILEIKDKQYKKYLLSAEGIDEIFYKAISIKWFITGNKYNIHVGNIIQSGVYELNYQTVLTMIKEYPTINLKLTNYLEFFRSS